MVFLRYKKLYAIYLAVMLITVSLFLMGWNSPEHVRDSLNGNSINSDTGMIDDISYEFIESDTFYSFTGSFTTNAKLKCIADITYSPVHRRLYTNDADSIVVKSEGENYYDINLYIQKYQIFRSNSLWRVTIGPDKKMIDFVLVSSDSNFEIDEKLISSKGYYEIVPDNDAFRITYYQECYLKPTILTEIYISLAKNDAMQFISDYKEYLEKSCCGQ